MHLIYFNHNYNTYCEFTTVYECFTSFIRSIKTKKDGIDLELTATVHNKPKELEYFFKECLLSHEDIPSYFYEKNMMEKYYIIYEFDSFIKVKLLGQNNKAYLLLDEHKRFHIYDISEELIEVEGFYFNSN